MSLLITTQQVGPFMVMGMRSRLSKLKTSKLVLCGVGPRLMELIKLTRLDRLLTIKPSQREAVNVWQQSRDKGG